MATLTKQVKDMPIGTEVKLVEISDGIATIRVAGKSLLIPASYVSTGAHPNKEKPTQQEIEQKIAAHMQTVVKPALKGYEATRLLSISCRCQKIQRRMEISTGWEKEKEAIDQVIRECSVCTPI